jgi:hypothetical protein
VISANTVGERRATATLLYFLLYCTGRDARPTVDQESLCD